MPIQVLKDLETARRQLKDALASGQDDLIAAVASEHAWTLLVHDYELLSIALERIPIGGIHQDDVLFLVHPVASTLARVHVGQDTSNRGTILKQSALTDAQIDEKLTTQMVARRLRGDVTSAGELAARVEERILNPRPSRQKDDGPVPLFLFQAGLTFLLAGRVDKALKTLSIARQLAEHDGQNHVQRDAAGKLAVAHAFKGSIHLAEIDLARSRELPYAPPFFAKSLERTERTADAMIEVEKHSPGAEERVEALEPFDTADELWPFMTLARSRFELARGNPIDALDAVTLAFDTHVWQSGSLADDIRTSITVDSFVALGEIGSAAAACRDINPRMVLSRLARIRVLLQSADIVKAARECRALCASSVISAAERDEAIVLQAWSNIAIEGTIDEGHARTILQIATTRQRRRIFAHVPASVLATMTSRLNASEGARFCEAVSDLHSAPEGVARPKLTPGELKALRALREDLTTVQIAEALFLSPNTIKTQLSAVYRKLGATNRMDAVARAARLNLLE